MPPPNAGGGHWSRGDRRVHLAAGCVLPGDAPEVLVLRLAVSPAVQARCDPCRPAGVPGSPGTGVLRVVGAVGGGRGIGETRWVRTIFTSSRRGPMLPRRSALPSIRRPGSTATAATP